GEPLTVSADTADDPAGTSADSTGDRFPVSGGPGTGNPASGRPDSGLSAPLEKKETGDREEPLIPPSPEVDGQDRSDADASESDSLFLVEGSEPTGNDPGMSMADWF